VSNLGAGNGSGYPNAIDTRQTFINSSAASPDSASRLDAELANDTLAAIVQVETALGAKPNGDFASVAARLQQFIPGGGASPVYHTFAAATTITIAGSTHNLATASPLVQVYDNAAPRQAIQPNTVSIDPASYDVTVTFVTAQSGVVCLANPVPQYTTSFTTTTANQTITISGLAHALGTPLLFVSVYALVAGKQVRQAGAITIHQTNFTVTVTLATPQTGEICISAAGPRYSTTFTSQTDFTIQGGTHGLGTGSLLYQLYNAAPPSTPFGFIEPNTLSVDPTSFNVRVTFATAQSGSLLLVGATDLNSHDFEIRDRGVTDVNAVRVFSELGTLELQMGTGNACHVQNPTGGIVQTVDQLGNLTIAGGAFKPGGGGWVSPSDERLKKDIRPFEGGLEALLALEPIWFRYNGRGGIRPTGQEHIGLLAQAVQTVLPYLVSTQPGTLDYGGPATDLLTLDDHPLIYLLLNAVKALYQAQQAQAARLTRIEAILFPEEVPT
jgi:hypothetical protein